MIVSSLNVSAQTVIVKLKTVTNYDVICLQKLNRAVALVDSVVQLPEFERRIRKKITVQKKFRSKKKILARFYSGANVVDPEKDGTIDLIVSTYNKYEGGLSFGRTSERTGKITTHKCFILNNDVRCLAKHLLHEYVHSMGYKHFRIMKGFGLFHKTVPYVFGTVLGDMLDCPTCLAQEVDWVDGGCEPAEN